MSICMEEYGNGMVVIVGDFRYIAETITLLFCKKNSKTCLIAWKFDISQRGGGACALDFKLQGVSFSFPPRHSKLSTATE